MNIEYFIKRLLSAVVCVMIWREDEEQQQEEDKKESNGQNSKIHKNAGEGGKEGARIRDGNSLEFVMYGWRCVLSHHDFILNFNLISHQRYANV